MKFPARLPMIIFATLLGCSATDLESDRQVYRIEGRVTFEGKPAGGAVVIFHPVDGSGDRVTTPRAVTDENGRYSLSYLGDEDGAPAGDYRVTVQWMRGGENPEQGTNLLPERFLDPNSSGLKVSVKSESGQVIDLALKRKP